MEKGRDERGRVNEKVGQSKRVIERKREIARLYKKDGKTDCEREKER
jgi:hypothetical protein